MSNIELAVEISVLGIGMVFIVLIILAVLIVVMQKVMARKTAANANNAEQPAIKEEILPVKPITTAIQAESADNDLSPTVVAVIAAAISNYLNRPTTSFMLTSVRKVEGSKITTWTNAGRMEVIGARSELYLRKGKKYYNEKI